MELDHCISLLEQGEFLPQKDIEMICSKARDIMIDEPNTVHTKSPVSVVGDIHGQLFDLLQIFKLGGDPSRTNYIFLGDYVDRGYHSVETFSLLLCYKIKYPDQLTLVRGNHESRYTTHYFGLYDEVQYKYGDSKVWKMFVEVFDTLPISAIIDGTMLCVHGGLSPAIKTIDQIETIDRKQEVPVVGPFTDLLWSDPDEDIETWGLSQRGAGFIFGRKVLKEFHHNNGLELTVRAHQLVYEGYKLMFPEQNLMTVWSAPNYCYRCGNVASFVEFKENGERKFNIFKASKLSSIYKPNLQESLPYFL